MLAPLIFCCSTAMVCLAMTWLACSAAHAQGGPPDRVEYLSDVRGSGYEWLEDQQRRAYGGRCKAITSVDELLEAIKGVPQRPGWSDPKDLFRDIGLDHIALPTRCESLPGYFLTNRISEEVRRVASAEAGFPVQRIIWGTLPVRDVNAAAQKVAKDYVVTINDRLFAFLYSLLLTVDRTIVIDTVGNRVGLRFSDAAFKEAMEKRPQTKRDFINLVVAFAAGAQLPDLQFANEHEAPLVIRQLNSIERFIVGHEFGHILAGDTEAALRMLDLPSASGGTFRVATLGRDWKQELHADETGQRLATAARTTDESGLSGRPPLFEAISAYAPALFLQLADALENALHCRASGQGAAYSIPADQRNRWSTEIAESFKSANPPVPDQLASLLGCRQSDHPPAWLRAELTLKRIDAKFIVPPRSVPHEVQLARALVENALALSKLTAADIQQALK